MQYKTGTVSVTNGNAVVTGSGTTFTTNVTAGDLFGVVGDGVFYEVASIQSNTQVTLSANYAGTTGSGKAYAITRSFTQNVGLPYMDSGDIETASIFKRAMLSVEQLFAARLSKSVAGGTTTTLTESESRYRLHHFTGALTASKAVVVPDKQRLYIVYNNTTGAYTLTIKTAAGTGIVVAQSRIATLFCTGTNVIRVTADNVAT